MLTEKEALDAVVAAKKAFGNGRGAWPSASAKERIAAVEKFMEGVKAKKAEIVNLLMWEICKPLADAEKEVDRTLKYVEDTIKDLKKLVNSESALQSDSGFVAKIRRVPLGVVLCSAPVNYPINELYTTFIPALLMGNTIILKIPRIGGLCHVPTLELLRDCFPPGVVNVVSGSGRAVMTTIMRTGDIDAFAFIGSTKAASALLKEHPKPNRLRSCLGLEAKNPAVVFPDADLSVAVSECVLGSLSFNGMRCTAIKIIYVHESICQQFLQEFCNAVDQLKMGMPWSSGVKITPLAEEQKDVYLDGLIQDALSKGAKIVNGRGGQHDRTIFAPTVLFPVDSSMRVFHEEQFGPVVPVRTFTNVEEIFSDLERSNFGQQAAVFSKNAQDIGQCIDALAHMVSRVNINGQCQRGPDSFPFTARKDSAAATLSVHDALRTFSIRSMVAAKESPENHNVVSQVIKSDSCSFMKFDYLL
jgi:glyceraldehyde-3-phosphate dehydrogenase (NADP+)